ncbi:MAG: hypothetical protein IJD48_00870 [Clostridia bacterium]|nr:hypothetical protein [Clostridia bacterium]
MEENKIIDFKKDDKFFFKKGNELIAGGEVNKAIVYIQKALNLAKDKNLFLKGSYYLMLAQAYSLINYIDLSNYYYYCALKSDVFAQLVFRGLGENLINQGDELTARFYLNECVNLLETSDVAKSAKARLEMLNKSKKKFRIINGKTDLSIQKAEELMSQGKFDEVVEILEGDGDFSNEKLRAELSLAYFFLNKTQKGKQLVEDYGTDCVFDLCNLLLLYYCDEDKQKYEEIKRKVRDRKDLNNEEYFKIGLTFAQTQEYDLAKLYMQQYLSGSNIEPELKFLYAILLINKKDFGEAKNILIDLRSLDPFNNYVFNYYLNICKTEVLESKLEYIFSIPVGEYLKIQQTIKDYLVLNKEELLLKFNENIDFFYFISSLPDTATKSALFQKLSLIEDKNLDEFFEYVLLSNTTKNSIKNKIMLNRLSLDNASTVCVVKDKIFSKITIPNNFATKHNNEQLQQGLMLSVKYFIEQGIILNINLKRVVIKLEKILNQDKNLPEVLAAIIVWEYTKQRKLLPLNKICKYFNISQEQFYDFANKYSIEV